MKSRIIIITASIIFSISTVFGQGHHKHSGDKSEINTTKAPDAFKKQLNNVLDEYIILKDALVASDETKAKTAAIKTMNVLDDVDMNLLKGDAHIEWMKQEMAIRNNLNGIVQMKGIEMKRSHFTTVSDNLSAAISSFGVEKQKDIYVDYCPMANNNSGGYWLSMDKEIQNPYFGNKMLKCGSVKAIL